MQQSKQTTVIGAAHEYCNGVGVIVGTSEKQFKAFIAGAEWQKQQDSQLLTLLKGIAEWPGNLSDKVLQSPTGPNDAAQRGGIICDMRDIAIEAIRRYEPDYTPFDCSNKKPV